MKEDYFRRADPAICKSRRRQTAENSREVWAFVEQFANFLRVSAFPSPSDNWVLQQAVRLIDISSRSVLLISCILTHILPMEFFQKAKYVRLRSQHGKYLCADDGATVSQHRDCAERNAKWKVEIVEGSSLIRLKSCYKCYLTASSILFLLGMAGKKVLQTIPLKLDSSVEWEPIKEGFRVKFKTRNGTYLQANGGLPPWRNSVTHDILHRRPAPSSILWEVEITETVISPSSVELESMPSLTLLPPRPGGRLIYYGVGDGNGNIEKDYAWPSFVFKGRDFYELTQKLEDETGVHDFIVCAYHPLSGKLYPLRSQLPPNNSSMHLVMVQTSSELARSFS